MSALIRAVSRLWRKKQPEGEDVAAGATEADVPDERQQLLPNNDGSGSGNGNRNGEAAHKKYFAINHKSDKNFAKTRIDPQKAGWIDYFRGFAVLFPYLWPSDSPLQQATVVLCLLLLIAQRVINVLVPTQLGRLVAALDSGEQPGKEAVLYVVFRALQGGQGVLGAARSVLWIPVSQSLFRRLSCASFEHVLGLSMDFHLSKRIGEVTSALNKGGSMNTFLDGFLFSLFPMMFDIFVAAVYFIFYYDVWYALTVIVIMSSYVFLTIWMAKYRGRARRDMTTKSREMDAVKTEALLAYETIHHDSAVDAEATNFANHVTKYQEAEWLVLKSLNVLNISQNMTFTVGSAIIVGLSVYKISTGEQTVAQFVSLITYFAQLQAPLNFFGTFYTMVQNNLIDAERMLDLFRESSGIIEKEDAEELINPKGEVKFEDVNFSYNDTSSALRGASFTVQPGTMTALVGESGSGKSTCLKLLFRFYDVTGGSISVDGHDLRDITLKSLRKQIGVVPQDTHLFNATLMYNLIHAKPNATEADVFSACKAANIHERILSFPDGYQTKVGERGMKLSGGERQRIAIARALLKNAQILLLDEATASLDSQTEKQIQDALENATSGRTTITIAHRLSTITKADQILVLHQGQIVERGTHHELLEQDGRYAAMWHKQTSAERKVSEAKENLGDNK